MTLAIVGSALILGSCVGTAWLLARFGFVPVAGITPAPTPKSHVRPIILELSRLSQGYGVAATTIVLSNVVFAGAAAGGAVRAANIVPHDKCGLSDSVTTTTTSTPTMTIIRGT
jgi:hypothetical protein